MPPPDGFHSPFTPRRVLWSARFLTWLGMCIFLIVAWESNDARGLLVTVIFALIPAWLVGRLVEIVMGWFGFEV